MAYFKWDWQQPPSYRQPAPGRLTLEELLGMQEAFAPPPKPKPVSSISALPPDQRKAARLNSLWAGMAALGAGASTGDWGRAAQGGVAQLQDLQANTLAQANAEQEQAWAAQVQAAQEEAARKKQEQEKRALFGMYQEVAEGESEPFVAQAEAAARTGSMAELEKLREQKPQRAAARLKGYDPDAWDTNKRLQEELEAELERQAKQKEWEEVEKKRQEEEAKIELQARIAQNQAGVLFQPRETPAEAAAKAEAVERVRQKYATAQGGAVKGSLYKQGEQIVFAIPPDAEHPKGQIIPLDGQPETVGNLSYFNLPGGVRMAQRKDHPEWGAFEVPQPQPGDPGYEANRRKVLGLDGGGGGPTRQGEPRPTGEQGKRYPQDQANVLLKATVEDLLEGASEADALAQLRRRGNVQGFTPEQILQRAKALAAAAKRGR